MYARAVATRCQGLTTIDNRSSPKNSTIFLTSSAAMIDFHELHSTLNVFITVRIVVQDIPRRGAPSISSGVTQQCDHLGKASCS